jgi:hypothetical protein
MSTHTPGPWEWECCDYSMAILHGPDLFADHVLSVSPCKPCQERADPKEWTWGRCTTPTLANARLIAAAPDLLEAIRCLVGLIGPTDDYLGMKFSDRIAKARAAIAKAEGRT